MSKIKKYIIKSNYKYEIEAQNSYEALEKWFETIEDELGVENETLSNELTSSLYAEIKK